MANLTERQTQVVLLAARGQQDRQIAARLRISLNTVRNHLAAAYRALGAQSRCELLIIALKRGWLNIDELAAEVEAAAMRADCNQEW